MTKKNRDINAVNWLNGSDLGYDIWNGKYKFKHSEKEEDFIGWLHRVSGGSEALASAIASRKFLFGGRTLTSRGTGNGQSYSNCYSSGYAPDSVEGMLNLNTNLALTYQKSGGQGLSLSKVRPKGSDVRGGMFKSDGIIPFMEIFNQTTASISQGGSRKGALMMSLTVWHPEIMDFISVKDGSGKITKANLSVEVDDEFMGLVDSNITSHTYEFMGKEYTINPVGIYDEIMRRAWSSAEPGVIYTDMFRNYNLMEFDPEYEIVTGNPCGEQPLPKDGACNLGSVNLSAYVLDPFTNKASFDLFGFIKDIPLFIRALDDVLEEGKDLHALQTQRDMAKNYRNIGLGVMGYGTMLMMMGIPYGSDVAKNITKTIFKELFETSVYASAMLAKERGAFPKINIEAILKSEMMSKVGSNTRELVKKYGLRNCSLLSIAPSGSIGTMLDISTGLEPYYALKYTRKTESLHNGEDVYYEVEVPTAKKAREAFGEHVLSSAMTIDWRDRVEVQGIMQEYIDTAISSTVNVPEETTIEELHDLYIYAWRNGLKGITIYREGSFEAILNSGAKKTQDVVEENSFDEESCDLIIPQEVFERGVMMPVPEDTYYIPKDMQHGCGRGKVMIGVSPSEKRITDVYMIQRGEGGCSKNIQGEAILISQILRLGGNLHDVKKTFRGVEACSSCTISRIRGKEVDGPNCPNILINLVLDAQDKLRDQWLNETQAEPQPIVEKKKETHKQVEIKKEVTKHSCPECGASLYPTGGCWQCDCGYAVCG